MSKSLKYGIAVTVGLLLIWLAVTQMQVYSPLILPGPLVVFDKIISSFAHDDLSGQIVRSIVVVLKGLGMASFLTCILLILAELSETTENIIGSLCALFHPLPGIAILPIFMLWFGLGENAIAAVIVHSVIWPLYTNLSAGMKSIPEIYGQVARGFGISGLSRWRHIILPAVLPHMLSGLRTGWARAWRALISAEMIFGAIGDGGGLGWFIFKSRVFMDTAGMFAGLIIVVTIGLLVEKCVFDKVESLTLRKWGMME